MLAGIISADLPLAAACLLGRTAVHESGHAIAALYYELPLFAVWICDDGTGRTSYCRRLGRAEAERYTITAFAGDEAEHDLFVYRQPSDLGDLSGIAAVMRRLDLNWGEERLDALRGGARRLSRARAGSHPLGGRGLGGAAILDR